MAENFNVIKYEDPSQEKEKDYIIYEAKKEETTFGGAKTYIENDCLYISALYVFPEYRRQHVASNLLDFIVSDVKNQVKVIRCQILFTSEIGYENLIDMYEKKGFEYNIVYMKKTL